jgi:hypothetical protein
MKICTKCGESKPLTEFHRSSRSKDGCRCTCKSCDLKASNAWDAKNPDKKRAKLERWRARHPEEIQKYNVEYYASHREEKKQKRKEYYAANREEILENVATYRREHHEEVLLREREKYQRNPEGPRASAKKYRRGKEKILCQKAIEYARAHPGERAARQCTRYARQLMAMPIWANPEAIKAFYLEAARLTKETGIVHSVDHIIPLQGKNVCGFHHEGNLQILIKRENSVKGNSFPEDGICYSEAPRTAATALA